MKQAPLKNNLKKNKNKQDIILGVIADELWGGHIYLHATLC